jgi:D-alanyl-D-alanine dipeptidase
VTSKFAAFSAVDHHSEIPGNFVHLREVIADIAEDLRYAGPNNFIGSPVPGYEA